MAAGLRRRATWKPALAGERSVESANPVKKASAGRKAKAGRDDSVWSVSYPTLRSCLATYFERSTAMVGASFISLWKFNDSRREPLGCYSVHSQCDCARICPKFDKPNQRLSRDHVQVGGQQFGKSRFARLKSHGVTIVARISHFAVGAGDVTSGSDMAGPVHSQPGRRQAI